MIHHEQLSSFLSKSCPNILSFPTLINVRQRREMNMRSTSSVIPVNTNKKPVEITKWVLDFILGLIMSSTSCSYFYSPAQIIKTYR